MNGTQQWWDMVHALHPELTSIVHQFCGEEIASEFRAAVLQDDGPLTKGFLQQAWDNAPDNPSIHLIPRWLALCSLLDGTIPYDGEGEVGGW